jgi:hypothetical protein
MVEMRSNSEEIDRRYKALKASRVENLAQRSLELIQ